MYKSGEYKGGPGRKTGDSDCVLSLWLQMWNEDSNPAIVWGLGVAGRLLIAVVAVPAVQLRP